MIVAKIQAGIASARIQALVWEASKKVQFAKECCGHEEGEEERNGLLDRAEYGGVEKRVELPDVNNKERARARRGGGEGGQALRFRSFLLAVGPSVQHRPA